jgi:hypothetical protein
MGNDPEREAALEARVRDLEAVLKQNHQEIQLAFKLSPAMSNLFGLLLSVPLVTREMVEQGGGTDGEGRGEMVEQRLGLAADVKIAMHRLRNHVRPHGVVIHSRRTLGYWMENADKAKVHAVLRDRFANTLETQAYDSAA